MRQLEVLTAADNRRIVAAATLRARLGVSASADDELGAIIDELTSRFEDFVRRPFALQRYRETLIDRRDPSWALAYFSPINPDENLLLRCAPVETASLTVTIDGVTRTDWEFEAPEQATLFLPGGWPIGSTVIATYFAGWLLPGDVTTWATGATYATGAWVRPSKSSLSPLLFQATPGGVAGATEPTWPTTAGAAVADGAEPLSWTARAVSELPPAITNLAIVAARAVWEGREGVSSLQIEGMSQRFDDTGPSGLPLFVERGLSRYVLHGA